MYYILNFYLGAILGSFAYVCVLRLPKNEDIVFKKSYCESCKKQIRWIYNIPLFSYLLLSGKSNCCGKKISINYFIIEFSLAIFFLINFYLFFNYQLLVVNVLTLILLIIILIDLREKIIFDIFPLLLIASGLITNYFFPNLNPFNISIINSIMTILISSTLFFLLQYFYKKVRKIEALGTGDIFLIAGLTAWTGFLLFLYLLIISSIIGIIYFFIFNEKNTKNFQIPYGSSLGLSFIILIYINKVIVL